MEVLEIKCFENSDLYNAVWDPSNINMESFFVENGGTDIHGKILRWPEIAFAKNCLRKKNILSWPKISFAKIS